MTHPQPVQVRAIAALVVLSVIGLAACTSSAGGSAVPSIPVGGPSIAVAPASEPPTAAPADSAAPSTPASEAPADSMGPTAVPTAIDPCTLVTPAEVSTLTGSTFTSGDQTTGDKNAKLCSYGQEGLEFEVLVATAPDAATAKQQEPAFKAQLEQAASQAGLSDMKLTELPDFEPGVDAAALSGSVTVGEQKLSGVAFYALKGAVFVALSDIALGGSVPTSDAMQAQGRTTLGRLP